MQVEEGETCDMLRYTEDLSFHLRATERYWLFQSVDMVGVARL